MPRPTAGELSDFLSDLAAFRTGGTGDYAALMARKADLLERIAADMLDGKLWDTRVGRATHYHAQSVRPFWISEMRKLDRIGEHTFYRPRRWTS